MRINFDRGHYPPIECYDIEGTTLQDLVDFLQTFIQHHGDLPVMYDNDGQQFLGGSICLYEAGDATGLEGVSEPLRRAVISS